MEEVPDVHCLVLQAAEGKWTDGLVISSCLWRGGPWPLCLPGCPSLSSSALCPWKVVTPGTPGGREEDFSKCSLTFKVQGSVFSVRIFVEIFILILFVCVLGGLRFKLRASLLQSQHSMA
jgi:hypothetical protein